MKIKKQPAENWYHLNVEWRETLAGLYNVQYLLKMENK